MSQGVENRGSLISVPLALRENEGGNQEESSEPFTCERRKVDGGP